MAHRAYTTDTGEWHYFDSTEEMEASLPPDVTRSWPAQAAENGKPEIKAGFFINKKYLHTQAPSK